PLPAPDARTADGGRAPAADERPEARRDLLRRDRGAVLPPLRPRGDPSPRDAALRVRAPQPRGARSASPASAPSEPEARLAGRAEAHPAARRRLARPGS